MQDHCTMWGGAPYYKETSPMASQRVDFSELNAPMLKWLLDDGTEIWLKMSLMRVTRTDERLPDGQFRHELSFSQAIEQVAPAGPIDVKKLGKVGE
jgi:hypothetical protein